MPKLLKLLLIAAFFNALSWIILIPIWQYPDEQAHFAQVQDVAELGYVPFSLNTSREIVLSEKVLGTERDSLGNNKFTYQPEYKMEYSAYPNGIFEDVIRNLPKTARSELVKSEATQNPPLYYFLGSIVYKIFYNSDLFTRVFAVRMMSLLIFLATIYLSYKIGVVIFKNNKFLPIVLASLVAFKPMLVFSSTGVLPDTLTNLLFTIVIFLGLKAINEGFRAPLMVFAIITIIAGVTTRQQFLIAVIILVFPIIYQALINHKNIKKSFLILLSLVVFIGFANVFGTQIPLISSFRIHDDTRPNISLFFRKDFFDYLISTARESYAQVWPWYWGVYKWLSLAYPIIIYRIINIIVSLTIIGMLIKILLIIKNKRFDKNFILFTFLLYSLLVYYLVIIFWDYLFRVRSGFSFGIQGRYFFPLITAHIGLMLIGLWQVIESLFKKYANFVFLTIVTLMVLFNNYSLFYVSSHFYDTTNLSIFLKQVSQYKPLILKGHVILLIILMNFLFQIFFLYKTRRGFIK